MSKKIKKSNKVIKSVIGVGIYIAVIGVVLVACVVQQSVCVNKNDEDINESHIGLVEIADGEWVSPEHYEDYMAEREVYMKSEAEREAIEREAFLKSLEETTVPMYAYGGISEENRYMLAKIAMAEAESEDIVGKALVIRVVLNRLETDEFPDTVEEVVAQKRQFTPIRNGRYDKVEPNDDCYNALQMVLNGWDESRGALYFEANTSKETWHSKNLTKLFTHGNHTFYSERGGK